jgi:8-oxo-dGTP diphosphatase
MKVMPITVALIRRTDGRVLLVRKRGTETFIQPGGKIEQGEDARTALSRELMEELSFDVQSDHLNYIGNATAPAANEPGVTVFANIFEIRCNTEIIVGAEIDEAVWINPRDPKNLILAPLTRDHILPLAIEIA